ncbi:thiamine-phosphate kinase, partial [Candidatus Bathyarchaeota archaeon]|nr:thiamine-phosphate kinase [Candidatus Bathyarchaeota archaeon]
ELLGLGMDDAVAKAFKNEGLEDFELIIAHTDMVTESMDMAPGMSYRQLAKKAVVANLSDLASKGARPLGLLFAWGLPSGFKVEYVIELARGLNEGALQYGTYILGGDLGEAKELTLAGFAMGLSRRDGLMRRSSAKPGQILALTGLMGWTALGFKILFEGLEAPRKLKDKALKSLYEPIARVREGQALAKLGGSRIGCMDISDGLAISLHQLASSSMVGAVLTNIPMDENLKAFALDQGLDPLSLCLYEGGEEYELLISLPEEVFEEARKSLSSLGCILHEIGYVTAERRIILKAEGREEEIKPLGWEHLREKPKIR